ncbi:hypothetical protein [Nocardioides zhouii]|uniref:Uncharacterized protein n=1 Tax=Nocardioides zhouii TaxID=1168729 RepID=A0A4Q2T419_9ACTN|nr:hypothetical protein [Nocardioides zhouii]RYC13332.1 hypothetical protein EUA94_05525 [Nocardioides zhouii]
MSRHLSIVGSIVLAAALAVVAVVPGIASGQVTDGVVLTISAPRSDKLVKGVWTRLPVTVTNTSTIPAVDVTVVGSGDGVRFRRLDIGPLGAQDSVVGHVWAKLRSATATLKLDATELGTSLARTSVKLASRPAPAPPRSTGWAGDGVKFLQLSGVIQVFRVATRTTCGSADLTFPTIPVPRNNEVYGTATGPDGSTSVLELEFVTPTRGVGTFTWSGPGGCRATHRFVVTATI